MSSQDLQILRKLNSQVYEASITRKIVWFYFEKEVETFWWSYKVDIPDPLLIVCVFAYVKIKNLIKLILYIMLEALDLCSLMEKHKHCSYYFISLYMMLLLWGELN